MANIKITDLTAYGNPTSTDVLPIVDVGADVTKKVSVADLLENAGSGTEALPGIAFDGDPDTGIYRPGEDQLAISTNGTGRLFVDASGNVSIGLSSSTTALNVTKTSSGTDSNTLLVQNRADAIGTTASIYFSTNSAGTGIERSAAIKGISGSGTDTELALFTNATGAIPTERLRITSAGRLLVGTSSDSGGALLQVNGDRIRVATAKTPASASDTGTAGEICWDASYIYVCTATNTWKRAALSTW